MCPGTKGSDLGKESYAHGSADADDGVDLAQPDQGEDHEGQELVREKLEQEEQNSNLWRERGRGDAYVRND